MPFVHSFSGIYPPARFDGLPWTIVRTEESSDNVTFTQINSQAITQDPTPATADPINVTVTTATIAAGYFRFRFEDAAARLSPYTGSVYSPAVASGDPYFTVAEARTASYLGGALSSATTYPDTVIEAMRTAVQDALENACGVAFTPRTVTEVFDGSGTTSLLLKWPRVTAVSAASVGGTALTASELTALKTYADGRVYNSNRWATGYGNVSITYTHGYATVPGRVKRAALLLTRRFLIDSPVSDRATSMTGQDGTTQFLVTAGVRNAIFDVPEANAIFLEYGMRAGVG